MPPSRAIRRRLPAVLLASVLGLVLGELILRGLGAAYLATRVRSAAVGALGPQGLVLVCAGDSNTFGIHEDARDSYPAQLERLLDEHVPGGPHRVVNLGLPGMNTRQVRNALPDALERYEPDIVLVLAGVNNTWSWTPDGAVVYADPPWYETLRLVKLGRLLAARLGREAAPVAAIAPDLGGGEGIERFDRGPDAPMHARGRDRTGRAFEMRGPPLARRIDDAQLAASIATDLRAIAELALDAARPLVVATYGSREHSYGEVNTHVRAGRRRSSACR